MENANSNLTDEARKKAPSYRAIPLWVYRLHRPHKGRPKLNNGAWGLYEDLYFNAHWESSLNAYVIETKASLLATRNNATTDQVHKWLRLLTGYGLIETGYTRGGHDSYTIIVTDCPSEPEFLRSGQSNLASQLSTELGRSGQSTVRSGQSTGQSTETEVASQLSTENPTSGTSTETEVLACRARPLQGSEDQNPPDRILRIDQKDVSVPSEGFRSVDPKQFAAKHWKAISAMRFDFRRLFPHSKFEKHSRGTGYISDECLDKLHLEFIGKGATDQEIFRSMQTYHMCSKNADPLGTADPLKVYASLQGLLNREKRWLRAWEERGEGCAEEIKRLYREAMLAHFQKPSPQEAQGELEDNGKGLSASLQEKESQHAKQD